MRNHVTRGLAAVATALCLLLTLATPAAANPYPLAVAGGTFGSGWFAIPLVPAGPGPCAAKPSTLAVTFAGDATSGTFMLTGGWSSQYQLGTPPSGQWYQADFAVVHIPPAPIPQGAYRWDNPPPFPPAPPPYLYGLTTAGPNHVILQIRISRIPSCEKTDLACILTMRMSFTGTVTSSTQLPTYTPGGITLNGTTVGTVNVASCSAPWASWAGQVGTINGMTLF
ncbi:MAG TPA: hypothetical protein VK507_12980 [Iamia sp.]|nr:hypothetical protein [Iamia sp.]